jgi:hypothetical protein
VSPVYCFCQRAARGDGSLILLSGRLYRRHLQTRHDRPLGICGRCLSCLLRSSSRLRPLLKEILLQRSAELPGRSGENTRQNGTRIRRETVNAVPIF